MTTGATLQSILTVLHNLDGKECIVQMEADGITRWTAAQIAETAQQLARGLVEAGVQRGDFIPILAANRPEWIVAALSIIAAGAAVSPLDSQMASPALERVLTDSEARYIFTTTDYINRLRHLDLNPVPRPILFDVAPDDARGWQALCSSQATPLPVVEPEEPAALFYTSGTTGVPKGVMLTHRNLMFELKSVQDTNFVNAHDRVLLPLPMYHVYPFTVGILTAIALGLPVILPLSLTGPQMIRALNEGEATIIIGVPRVYRAVYNGMEARIAARGKVVSSLFHTLLSLSIAARLRFGWQIGKWLFRPVRALVGAKVRLLTSGGSALDPELAWKLVGFGWDVGIGYGLTETSPMLTINVPSSEVPRLDSVGPALPGIELRIDTSIQIEDTEIDTPGEEGLPPEGEVQARGVSVFSGYRNLPEQTAEAFTSDGWFRTGDLGYFDKDGYLYISGRASTLIVLEGGKKIQPDPLEDIYQQHEFIREIGILYEQNQLAAVIVPEPEPINRLRNGDVKEAIREAVSERVTNLPSYQRITDYVIVDMPLPRTNLGKIRRHVLTSRYNQAKLGILETDDSQNNGPLPIADMSEQDQTLLANPNARQIWDWLSEHYPDKRLNPDTSPQLDLGIDSLEWMTLTLQVSDKTGVELSDEAIKRITTVRDLLREVCTAESGDSDIAALDDPHGLLDDEQKGWLLPPNALILGLMTVIFPIYRLLMRRLFKIRVNGLEHLPKAGNFVLTPNHTSMLDAPALASTLTLAQMRQTHWAGASDVMLTNPLMRLISRASQVLPIERYTGGTGMKNLALVMVSLQNQKNMVWFPEGRIATTGNMLPFREGIGIVLEKYPVPVVPVYIEGAREAMPVEASFPSLKPISITFGAPCDPLVLAQEGNGETTPAKIVSALQMRVESLKNGQT